MWCWNPSSDARLTPRAPFRGARGVSRACLIGLLAAASAAPAAAQSVERFTADSVIEVDAFGGQNVSNQPQIIIDLSASMRIGDHWRVWARPWFRQARPTTPNGPTPPWDTELYEAGVRYERPGAVALRVEAGYLPSPIGLGILDWRPSTNPTIVPHLSYAIPLLGFDRTLAVRPSPIANSYPLAGQVTLSASQWDLHGAVLNASPTRPYVVGNTNVNPKQTPNVVLGGGVTPMTGLRLGVSFATGDYATPAELTTPSTQGRRATIVGGEGEFAFGYTSLRGELLHTSFETAGGSAPATEWFLQGMQIITPRWFGAGRVEHSGGPPASANAALSTDLDMVETTAGFRVNPDITLRGSYYARHLYGATGWDHQVGVSIVWAKRWW